ncbi:oxidoreductase [Kushneria aurantia]|uniref:Oxidoreductase n=1 Tax=Kushneria aurantia TaxID=504092 RepID=A0ABV6G2Q2_9GAMM|nr:oxidoreductase [Kushneria aurantia]
MRDNLKTIVITGVSSGLGRSIALEALARGHRVVGTLRQEEQRAEFEALEPGRSIGRLLDVTDHNAIQPFVEGIEREFGAIDVLLNNAGYGLQGVIEELDADAMRRQYDVNVFAPVALIQAVLPSMRRRRAGHIVNMVSMGGIIAFPNLGAYNSSKFAFLGLNESLTQEVASLGIKVTAIMPGVYRSDWASRSQARTESRIADYDPITSANPDVPWGDPAALGRVVLDAIEMNEPPEHLLVGPVALDLVRKRLAKWTTEIDRWEALSYADGEG